MTKGIRLERGLGLIRSTAADTFGLLRCLIGYFRAEPERAAMCLAGFLFALTYLFALFPRAGFRGDDWRILAAAQSARDYWHWIWSDRLAASGTEVVWFFRPGFKFLVHGCYRLFGLSPYAWFLVPLVSVLSAVALGGATLTALCARRAAAAFAIAFLASYPIHAGSLLWLGEGLMNGPQLFFLALNLRFFEMGCRLPRRAHRSLVQVGGWLSFVAALSLKEAAIFHPLFLACLLVSRPQLSFLRSRHRWSPLLPYLTLSLAYLLFRFHHCALNPGYFPAAVWAWWLRPAAILIPTLGTSFVVWSLIAKPSARELRQGLVFLPALGISLLPYVGHPFFSPGWLLLPGFYLLFFLSALVLRREAQDPPHRFPEVRLSRSLGPPALLLAAIGIVAILVPLWHAQWFRWAGAQAELRRSLRALPPKGSSRLTLLDCTRATRPDLSVTRVLGDEDSLYGMSQMLRSPFTRVEIKACDERNSDNSRALRWDFPHLTPDALGLSTPKMATTEFRSRSSATD